MIRDSTTIPAASRSCKASGVTPQQMRCLRKEAAEPIGYRYRL